jgi:hypothetical protein
MFLFHNVDINFPNEAFDAASRTGLEIMPDQIMVERQLSLLASTPVNWVHALKSPALCIEMKRDTMVLTYGNAARTESCFIDFDGVAMKEWHDYVSESLDVIEDASPDQMREFLSRAFINADMEKFQQASKALGEALGKGVLEQSSLQIGEGPQDHSSIKVLSKLAHAVLTCVPDVQDRYTKLVATEDDQPKSTDPNAPSFHSI